jgi:hypothetical protein
VNLACLTYDDVSSDSPEEEGRDEVIRDHPDAMFIQCNAMADSTSADAIELPFSLLLCRSGNEN